MIEFNEIKFPEQIVVGIPFVVIDIFGTISISMNKAAEVLLT